MGRPMKITSAKKMQELWETYKIECDNQQVLTHDFSSKNSEFVSKELKRRITYTIEGFCVFAKISRQAFYENYAKNVNFIDIVTRIREECEVDARKKFELQLIPSQLAGLWMSKYGYTARPQTVADEDEQRARIDNIKANTAKIKEDDPDSETEDDGFLEALKGQVNEIWQN